MKKCAAGINRSLWPSDSQLLTLLGDAGGYGEKAFNAYFEQLTAIRGDDVIHLRSIIGSDLCYGRSFVHKDRCVIDALTQAIRPQHGRILNIVNIGAGHGITEMFLVREFKGVPIDITAVEINENLVKHLENVAELAENMESNTNIFPMHGDIVKGVKLDFDADALLSLNVLHFVEPQNWPAFFVNCASIMRPYARLFLSVSAPSSSYNKYPTAAPYQNNKKLGKKWPGHFVRFDFNYDGSKRGVAYAPYDRCGQGKKLGQSLKVEGYQLPAEIKQHKVTSIAIPCLVFDRDDFQAKLQEFAARFFNIENVFGMTAEGAKTENEKEIASIGAILKKRSIAK